MNKIMTERSGPVLTIIINRPDARNALDLEATVALGAAIAGLEADASLAVAVLWGAGGAFCAGADLREMAAAGAVYRPWTGADGPLAKAPAKPLIAAIEGHAVAGGLGLALWCDLRVAAETAVFGVFCRRFGVPMSDGTTVRLPRLIGLADRVVPAGTARAAAEALAAEIAGFPQAAMLADRASAIGQSGLNLPAAFAEEAAGVAEAKRSDAQSGAARFAGGQGRGGRFDD